jgi:hypothetical protein
MSEHKYSTGVIKEVRAYIKDAKRPNISGLASHLGVSRQCIYDWKNHKEFLLVLNNMLHGVIDGGWVPRKALPKVKKNMVPEVILEPEFKDELDDDIYESIDG